MRTLSSRPGWNGDSLPWINVFNRKMELASVSGSAEVWEDGVALWAVSRHHKVPCGDAAISKMQIAHFLDFVSGFG